MVFSGQDRDRLGGRDGRDDSVFGFRAHAKTAAVARRAGTETFRAEGAARELARPGWLATTGGMRAGNLVKHRPAMPGGWPGSPVKMGGQAF
ncbi:hypothetical protein MASR2M50_16820 [Thauera sp.]|jgi:hypothetical protein